jgi:hypothetical protein
MFVICGRATKALQDHSDAGVLNSDAATAGVTQCGSAAKIEFNHARSLRNNANLKLQMTRCRHSLYDRVYVYSRGCCS